jgi:hypothetical protein
MDRIIGRIYRIVGFMKEDLPINQRSADAAAL